MSLIGLQVVGAAVETDTSLEGYPDRPEDESQMKASAVSSHGNIAAGAETTPLEVT